MCAVLNVCAERHMIVSSGGDAAQLGFCVLTVVVEMHGKMQRKKL